MSNRQRLGLAVVAGLVGAAFYLISRDPLQPSDLLPVLDGARAWLAGAEPYAAVPRQIGIPLVYPFTAMLALLPFLWIPSTVFFTLWSGLSLGLLAWALSKEGVSPKLLMLVSPPMMAALHFNQWAPLLIAASLLPWGGSLLACKPTTAAYLFAYRPGWRHLVTGGVFVALSLLLWPSWPWAWVPAAKALRSVVWPVTLMGGPLLLLATLEWRRPEARLLLAMVLVPHPTLIYETLPLFLITSTWAEAGILWIGSVATITAVNHGEPYQDWPTWARAVGQWSLWWMFLPALIMVLRKGTFWRRLSTRKIEMPAG